MMYIDIQDPSRLVQKDPKGEAPPGNISCRVYFRNLQNIRQDPQFYGKTYLPERMFDPGNPDKSFVPWNREAELEKQKQIEELQKRKNMEDPFDDEDFDDYRD